MAHRTVSGSTSSNGSPEVVIAVDPGRHKCGVAVLDLQGQVRERQVLPTERLGQYLEELAARWRVVRLVLGDGTGAQAIEQELIALGLAERLGGVVRVDEHLSSVEGRRLYWRHRPPRGWRRLLPTSLQTPPEPFDHFVAEVLARRFLGEFSGVDKGGNP